MISFLFFAFLKFNPVQLSRCTCRLPSCRLALLPLSTRFCPHPVKVDRAAPSRTCHTLSNQPAFPSHRFQADLNHLQHTSTDRTFFWRRHCTILLVVIFLSLSQGEDPGHWYPLPAPASANYCLADQTQSPAFQLTRRHRSRFATGA